MSHELEHLEHDHPQPDAWHRHGAEEDAPQAEHAAQVNTVALAVVFVGMSVSVVALTVIVAVFFQRHITTLRQERVEIVSPIADIQLDYRAQTTRELATYGWVNEEAQTVRVPIESVYDTIVQEYADNGQ